MRYSLVFLFTILSSKGACQSMRTNKFKCHNKLLSKTLNYRGGQGMDSDEDFSLPSSESEFKLGKDRELFHVSLDLKWVWSTLFNTQSWMQTARKLFGGFGVIKNAFNIQAQAKEISVKILSEIRSEFKASTIKLFGGTLPQAQQYAVKKHKFLLVYVENNKRNEKMNQSLFRKALADPAVGNLINEQFVFYGSSTDHSSTYKIIKALGARDYPYLAIVFVAGPLFKDMEVLAVMKPGAELKPEKLLKFLNRALEVHGGRLLVSKKERERVQSELALLVQQKKERETVVQAARSSALEEQKLLEAAKVEAELKKIETKRRQLLLKSLPEEPKVSSSSSSVDKDVVAIALKLPSGNRHERRFRSSETTMEVVLRWADAVGVDLTDHELVVITPPKRVFRSGKQKELKKTLTELQLPSSIVIIAQKQKVEKAESSSNLTPQLATTLL